MAMIFRSQSLSDGKLRGRIGSAEGRLARTFTNRVMFGSEGCREKGSFAASLMTSRAGEIMISHLNGNCFASAARSTDSLTFSRTKNVPEDHCHSGPIRLGSVSSQDESNQLPRQGRETVRCHCDHA